MNNLNREIPKPGQLYKHFKDKLYQIVAVAEHSESGEAMVVYQALYGTFKVYVRPLDMFLSEVDRDKYPDVVQHYRFERIEITENGSDQTAVLAKPQNMETTCYRKPEDENAEVSCDKERTTQDMQRGNVSEQLSSAPRPSQPVIDSGVWEFLDAGSFEERMLIFTGMQHRLTDDMINIMAVSLDTEVPEGSLEERIASLKSFLQMQVKFECSRLR